ncbi:MAG: 30S ribosomal protein S16 [Thermoguttaceae bacterium]|nr:30S ribosomal protein S16 [Thermoguttaceae bacterium]MDW8078551.1 30S ribosomal protein S16 [Thermoguttaceae bacterium]
MAVRIRMKKMGRRHRPFYRICIMDARTPRDGREIEVVGTYDPMVRDEDARVKFNLERVSYWLSVGAQPTEKVAILLKKYGPNGTRLKQNQEALARLAEQRARRAARSKIAAAALARASRKPEATSGEETDSES